MKQLLSILCLVLLSSCEVLYFVSTVDDVVENWGHTGSYESKHDTGELGCRGHMVNSKNHGLEECFYKNGQLYYRKNWKNGKQHGLQEEFYENGQLKSKGEYNNGHKRGIHGSFSENGQLILREHYTVTCRIFRCFSEKT